MEKKEFLDKDGLGLLVTQTRSAISTAKSQAISQAATDADSKVNALGVAVRKYSDDADNLIKANVVALQDAVWPLEVTFTAQPTVAKVGVATQVVLSFTAKRAGKPLDPINPANDATINGETYSPDGGVKNLTIAAQDATAGKHNYTLVVKAGNLTKTMTAGPTFVYPSYVGAVPANWAPTASGITALTELLNTSRACTRTGISVTNGKIVYAYPKSYGVLTSVKDGNNFEVLGSYTRSEITINSVAYYVYLLTNPVTASGVKQIFA